MTHRRSLAAIMALFLGVVIPLITAGDEKGKRDVPPDLTKGADTRDIVDGIVVLGATGAYGWIWGNQTVYTHDSKQIYVTKVDKGSPAEGVLQKGDVILGVVSPAPQPSSSKGQGEGGGLFAHDARREFANALTEAEKEENKGRLVLTVWREGKVQQAAVTLKVMGTCNFTTDCQKSRVIIERACNYLKEHGLGKPTVGNSINALGLLATGREEYIPMVRKYAHEIGSPDLKLNIETHVPAASWNWGYALLFLTEYYAITKDEYVLPAIKEYATKLAMGQTGAGTWGHMMANLQTNNGKLHGFQIGYGSMNQPGLVCAISLVLAQKVGVNNEEIAQAIKRSANFFRYYVDRGGIPYGEHEPVLITSIHDYNGRTALAAIFFDLLGDEEAASFFSKMALAGYSRREEGHSGFFFSWLWGGLGAARSGESAFAAYMQETQWYLDLERRWEGDFVYQGEPGVKNLTHLANGIYRGFGMTGARLLHYSLPLKKLYITGKGGGAARKVVGKELDDAISYGRWFEPGRGVKEAFAGLTMEQVMQSTGSWSPIVRKSASEALGDRAEQCGDRLIAMLDSPERFVRYGACRALGKTTGNGSLREVEALIQKGLLSKDPILVENAIAGLIGDRFMAHRSVIVPALLSVAATDHPQGPDSAIQRNLSVMLFGNAFEGEQKGILRDSIAGQDRGLLVSAIKNMLKNMRREHSTTSLISISRVFDKLTFDELKPLWKPIYDLVEDKNNDVKGMGVLNIKLAGFQVMVKHRIKEGLDLGIVLITKADKYEVEERVRKVLPGIAEYGAAAKERLPEFEGVLKELLKSKKSAVTGVIDKAMAEIQKGNPVKLISIAGDLKDDLKKRSDL